MLGRGAGLARDKGRALYGVIKDRCPGKLQKAVKKLHNCPVKLAKNFPTFKCCRRKQSLLSQKNLIPLPGFHVHTFVFSYCRRKRKACSLHLGWLTHSLSFGFSSCPARRRVWVLICPFQGQSARHLFHSRGRVEKATHIWNSFAVTMGKCNEINYCFINQTSTAN